MKNKKMIDAWNKIIPTNEEEKGMLENILKRSEAQRSSKVPAVTGKTALTFAAACLLLIIAISGSFLQKENNNPMDYTAQPGQQNQSDLSEQSGQLNLSGQSGQQGQPGQTAQPGQSDQASQADPANGATAADEKSDSFSGFILTAYAAETEGTYLTDDYQKDTIVTELKPYVKVLLANYSPLMNSVPGFPFTFHFNTDDINTGDSGLVRADGLKITADNGDLLSWDNGTGIITSHGTSVTCNSGETLYWSPLSADSSRNRERTAKDTQITVTAMKNGEELGRQIIYISEVNGNYYAEIGELIQL
jgi:hypothetical protein